MGDAEHRAPDRPSETVWCVWCGKGRNQFTSNYCQTLHCIIIRENISQPLSYSVHNETTLHLRSISTAFKIRTVTCMSSVQSTYIF